MDSGVRGGPGRCPARREPQWNGAGFYPVSASGNGATRERLRSSCPALIPASASAIITANSLRELIYSASPSDITYFTITAEKGNVAGEFCFLQHINRLFAGMA